MGPRLPKGEEGMTAEVFGQIPLTEYIILQDNTPLFIGNELYQKVVDKVGPCFFGVVSAESSHPRSLK